MEPRAVGLETEYAQCMERRDRGLRVVDAGYLFERMEKLLLEAHPSLKANSFGRCNTGDGGLQIREGRFLRVGARFYYDTGHLEWASPETTSAQEAALYDVAAERTLAHLAARIQPPGEGSRLMIVKNNIDYVRHTTYGCHENYQALRGDPRGQKGPSLARLVAGLVPFLVTRQIYTGAGRMGGNSSGRQLAVFQISQRADFVEQVTSTDTRGSRALINLRDEALADANRYRRLHLILGDSNRSPEATILKVGATRLVLRLIEMDKLKHPPEMDNPIRTLRDISVDLSCKALVPLRDRRAQTPVEIQRWYLQQCERLEDLDSADGEVIEKWRRVLDDLEIDVMRASDRVDWIAKWKYLVRPALAKQETTPESAAAWSEIFAKLGAEEAHPDRPPSERLQRESSRIVRLHQLDWADYGRQLHLYYELRERDLRYHDLDSQRSLFSVLCTRGLIISPFTETKIEDAKTMPPQSRAQIRARVIDWAHQAGTSASTTVDWDKASISGVQEPVEFSDPCAVESPNLERIISGSDGSVPGKIRILNSYRQVSSEEKRSNLLVRILNKISN